MEPSLGTDERKRRAEPIEDALERCSNKLRRLNILSKTRPHHQWEGENFGEEFFNEEKGSGPSSSTALVLYKEPAPVSERCFRLTVMINQPQSSLGRALLAEDLQMCIDSLPSDSQALTVYSPIEELIEKAVREEKVNEMDICNPSV